MRKAMLAVVLGLAGCAPPGASGGGDAPAPATADGPKLRLEAVATGLARPVGVVALAADDLLVLEQDGRIRRARAGQLEPTPYLDLNTLPDCAVDAAGTRHVLGFTGPDAGNERGLLGLALHPQFPANGLAYVDFTDGQGDTVVARFHRRADGAALDPASCEVVLRVDQPFSNHNGGQLRFGPDGFLYVGLGDGGKAEDPCNFASTLAASKLQRDGDCAPDAAFLATGGNADSHALLGKLLRLDVNQRTPPGAHGLCGARADGSAAYAAPADNAHAGGRQEACAETWTLGWRNPWRFDFDRTTGDLYVGDVGQNQVEEIDRLPAGTRAGGHYGWRDCEGDRDNRGGSCAGTIPPWLTYRHDAGRCSVTGGQVYRGPDAALRGRYLFGDYCTGEIFVATPGQPGFRVAAIVPAQSLALGITSIDPAPDGGVYLVFHGLQSGQGAVYALHAAP
ncbi:MAG TPA: PQQ-dependent sugar dehydrogenase [Burkholderiaceae bacterium]